MILPIHALRDIGEQQVLVREGGLRGSELYEELAVVVTAETLCRHLEEIEAAMATADQEVVERIEANYGGTFPLVGRHEQPVLLTALVDDWLDRVTQKDLHLTSRQAARWSVEGGGDP